MEGTFETWETWDLPVLFVCIICTYLFVCVFDSILSDHTS